MSKIKVAVLHHKTGTNTLSFKKPTPILIPGEPKISARRFVVDKTRHQKTIKIGERGTLIPKFFPHKSVNDKNIKNNMSHVNTKTDTAS
jgi:hypothetical protein